MTPPAYTPAMLAEMIAKVEAGWPPDIDTPYMPPFNAVFGVSYLAKAAWDANEGSLDAAKDLHDAVLPSYEWGRTSDGLMYVIKWMNDRVVHKHGETSDHSPARAWLLAILRALHTQAELDA